MIASSIGALCLVAFLAAADELTARDLFDRFQAVYSQSKVISCSFEEETIMDGQKRVAHGRIFFQKPNRLRQEYVDPNDPDILAQLVVLDGAFSWSYTPWLNQVTRQEMDPEGADELLPGIGGDFEDVPTQFDLSVGLDEIAAAQNVYLLVMRPKAQPDDPSSGETLEVWIRGSDWTPVQFSYTSSLDNVTTVIRLQKLDMHAEVEPGTFEFDPPAGTEVITMTRRYKSDE
jgi:outer membrane lipoprotein-sorting protein